jgi:integral membrane protein
MNNERLLQFLRIVAILEGVSYLSFAITMPLKYWYEMHGPNYVVGMAHGLLFIAYLAAVGLSALRFKWSFMNTFWSGLASLIPFGTFVMDHRFFRHEVRKWT